MPPLRPCKALQAPFACRYSHLLEGIQNNKPVNNINGHAFCECLVDGEWKLLDPTFAITEKSYNPEHIKLTGLHNVKQKKHFIPISREIDTNKKQNVRQHNEQLQDIILDKTNEKPKITPVTREDLIKEGYFPEENNSPKPQTSSQSQNQNSPNKNDQSLEEENQIQL